MRVLLVEDDDDFAHVLREALEPAKLKVELERCRSIAEAAALFADREFDAVLLDVNLPDSAGLGTIARVHDLAPGMPIVVLTADDAEAGPAAVQHGAQDYIVKNETDGKYISLALRYAIERAGSQAELARREQHFRALIEQAYDIVVVLAQDGTFATRVRPRAACSGTSPKSSTGRTCWR